MTTPHAKNDQTDELIEKFKTLMIRTRKPFIEQINKNENVEWTKHKRVALTDEILSEHIAGTRTVGVYYFGKATIFLFFDVDAREDAHKYVKAIIYELNEVGINRDDVHVMFSGQKGYHIQLYFDDPLPISRVVAFGRSILQRLGLDKQRESHIELRPESLSGKGVKLPLAYHKASGKRAVYVNRDTVEPVSDSEAYFLSIEPMPKKRMEDAIKCELARTSKTSKLVKPIVAESFNVRSERIEREFSRMHVPNDINDLRRYVDDLRRNGLRTTGTRNLAQFLIALRHKETGTPLEATIADIKVWVQEQWERGTTKERKLETLFKDAERNVTAIYQNERYQSLYSCREPLMTYGDALWAAGFKEEKTRKILWAFLLVGRMYHNEGRFFVSLVDIEKMTGITRKTISKYLRGLIEAGVIKVVESYRYNERKATTYYMERLVLSVSQGECIPMLPETTKDRFDQSYQYVHRFSNVA